MTGRAASPAIEVCGLTKTFVIAHRTGERYATLRESLVRAVRNAIGGSGHSTRESFDALNDVSFRVERGDRVGILGRNGAGKSTLLKILSRVTEPTAGRILLNGRVASLLEVGTGFHPELSGRENIYLNGAILGMSRQEIGRRFDEIVAFAEIERFLDTPVKRYSSGMYVRLAFAVAAHLESEILLVDEVLAVGDAQFQRKCLGKMEDVSAKGGKTVLFVSHNASVMRHFCSRGLVLHQGRLRYAGSLEEALSAYARISEVSTAPVSGRTVAGGPFYFSDVALIDRAGNRVTAVATGDAVTIRATYACSRPINRSYIAFDFTIKDGYRQTVASFISDEMPNQFAEFGSSGVVLCEIDRLLLRGGRYFLRLFACYNGTGQDSVLDEWEDAIEFEVSVNDFYGSGRPPRPGATALLPARFANDTLISAQSRTEA